MNSKLYKLVFCHRLGCLIAVGEFTRAYGKSCSTTGRKIIKGNPARVLNCLVIMTGLALGTLPLLVLAHPSLPVNGKIVIGQGALDINNTTLTVTQQSDKLAINWRSFDIAQGSSVIYNQPGTQSIALNRVLGRNASEIYGSLKANGQIFLLNPNGVLFGRGAEVNVGGLVATTKSMSDQDFLNGRYTLTSPKQEGRVINQANLRAASGGYIALVGQQVNNQNSGAINAPKGRVILAGGQRVTLNLDHGQLLGVQVRGEQVAALIQNGGLIQADGGVIQLTVRGKDMLMNTVIDNTGILQANGLSEKNGVIQLDGGDEGVIRQQGVVNVAHPQGRGGDVTLQGKNIHLVAGSKIDARGADSGGQILVGGGWQGKNKQIRNAHSVVMDKGAEIDASATGKGHGGSVVLWSENYTGFYGDIKTRGGPESGSGGKVETSSKRNLQAFGQVDAAAIGGEPGVWLLDPAEVNIVGSGDGRDSMLQTGDIPAGYVTNAQIFIPTANIAQILNSSINSQLDSGTNVTITTSNSSLLSCRWCNITLQADINKTAGADATLTLHADGNIVTNNNITANAGKLNLNLLSGNLTVDSVITLNNSEVLLNGGDLVARHANENNTARISIIGGRYNVGNLTLEGNTGVASLVGVNISNAANITVAGETRISGESSNSNGQGWRSIEISGNSTLVGKGNITFTLISNSKTAWMGSFSNTIITSDNNILFQANGTAWGGLAFNSSKLTSSSGNVAINLNGTIITASSQGVNFNNGSLVSGQHVNVESHITGADSFLLANSRIVATAGDINANSTTTNKGMWISGNSSLNASGNVVLQGVTTGALAGADGIKISGNSTDYANITAGGNISMNGRHLGKEAGMSIIVDYAKIESLNGDYNLNITGTKTSNITNSNISANNIIIDGNITASDALILTNVFLAAKSGNISANLSSVYKSLWFKGSSGMTASQNIILHGNSTKSTTASTSGGIDAIKMSGISGDNRINIMAGNNIFITANNNATAAGTNINIENVDIKANNGSFNTNTSGLKSTWFTNTNITANDIEMTSDPAGLGGVVLSGANVTSTVGDVNINTIATNKGIWIKANSSLNSNRDITLNGEANSAGEGVVIQGASDSSRNIITAKRDITLKGHNSNVSAQDPSINLSNVNLESETGDIAINGIGLGNVNFTNVELNATAGNMAVYAETAAALTSAASSALSLGGNNTIKAQKGMVVGKALNTTQGAGIGFRENNILSVEGNIAFQGETEGTGVTRKGIDFYGVNTLNIAKGSQLSLVGENKGAQDTAGGNGITHSGPVNLAINNNGSLIMEGRSTSGSGINFPSGNNTVILKGEGDTLIKGSSTTGSGVAISGVVNNSTGPVTIEGISSDGSGVHLFSAEHQINNISITGNSTHAEGLRISGNATITDTKLNGSSINGGGVKIDSLPSSNVATRTVLDNATLSGISTNGKGVEITSEVKGIHHSTVNGTINGTGYALDIAENVNVTGTSETDLLTLKGAATTGAGTGIKLNGNNDLSNTSLNGSAVDGIALDIGGPLTNSGYTALNGTASGIGTGVYINGALNNYVVNGTSASGIGVNINGSLIDSRIYGTSASGNGVKVDGDTILNNTALVGNSTDGKGVEIAGNLTGNQTSQVRGDSVNGIAVMINNDVSLIGGGAGDPLAISGNASGDKGTGIQLEGNNTLDNTALAGNSTDGHGVEITGPVTNKGNSTITGNASNNGYGVHVDGPVTGGAINGTSGNNHGVFLDDDAELTELAVIGAGKAPVHITSPELIRENVTINGKLVDKNTPLNLRGRDDENPNTTKTRPDPISGGKITIVPPPSREPESLLIKREQILSSLEEYLLAPSIVAESEKAMTANISISLCIPQDVSPEQQPCDEHLLGRWVPATQTEQ